MMMTMKTLISAMALAALAGCSTGSNQVFSSSGPDEFMVVSRKPLQMPQDPRALPAPQPGAPNLVDPDPRADAQAALFPATAGGAETPPSAAESALLTASGADDSDPEIRTTLAEEAPPEVERRFGLDSFLGTPITQNPGDTGEQLDSARESERLIAGGAPSPTPPPLPEP